MKDKLSSLTKKDIVIFSGSKPNGLTADYYQELIAIVKEAGAEFVIDTTGPELFAALPDQPLLIKPNNHELAELYQTTFHSFEDILPYGQKLIADGAKRHCLPWRRWSHFLYWKRNLPLECSEAFTEKLGWSWRLNDCWLYRTIYSNKKCTG